MNKTISFSGKCSDCFQIRYPNGKEHLGYVPFEIGIGGGDYIELEIDVETGKVVGWEERFANKILSLQSDEETDEETDE